MTPDTFAHHATIQHLSNGRWQVMHSWLTTLEGRTQRLFSIKRFRTKLEAEKWRTEVTRK